MKIKVKNIHKKDKTIKLLNGESYTIKVNNEKIVGDYSDDARKYIFDLLKKGFEVSKISEEYVKDNMIISNHTEMTSEPSNIKANINTNETENKPKRKRGRPKKNP